MQMSSVRRAILASALTTVVMPAAAEDTAVRTFFRRTIGLTEAQIAEVDAGRVVTRQLPGADKPEMAAFGAVRVASSKDTFLQRLRDVTRFRQGPPSLQIGRFHTPPVPEDLDCLTLEDGDFDAARQCKPGDCDLKLARSALDAIKSLGRPDILLVDLRETSERAKHGTISGALHAPYPGIAESLKPGGMLREVAAATGRRVVFFCAFGERSAMAVAAAKNAGLANTAHIEGGIDAWKKVGGPVVTG